MPLEVIETTGLKHDGPIAEKLKDLFILVCEHAYFYTDKAEHYAKEKQNFVIRLKDNVQVNRKKSLTGHYTQCSNHI